jgi:hypothetical protein
MNYRRTWGTHFPSKTLVSGLLLCIISTVVYTSDDSMKGRGRVWTKIEDICVGSLACDSLLREMTL